jgi:hypothetical protein
MFDELSDWLALGAAVGMLLFGGGGVVAWRKQHADAKNGVRNENRADVDSLNARAVAIVETQFNFLIQPLQEEVAGLKTEVKSLRIEVESYKTMYWKAVTYIRQLTGWIARHMPMELEQTEIPTPPVELLKDI